MGRPKAYSLAGYGDMITDRERFEPYRQALRQAVRPGCVVLDIGAGTGIFSLLACQMGAGHVHAVEPDEVIELAREMTAANGYADRVTFHQALSTAVTLPVPAGVIISDLRGILPLYQQHIPSIIDARQRLLAPDGVLVPRRDTLWAALAEDETAYRRYTEPWLSNDCGLDLRAGHWPAVNAWHKVRAKPEQLLVSPQCWATLDYAAIMQPDVSGELVWQAERPGVAHGLLIWFDAELASGIGFSNAPGQPELIYGQAFFPLQAPVTLEAGDQVSVVLRADLSGDDYVWQWRTRITAASPGHEEGLEPAGEVKADFRQSTFHGAPISPSSLRKREAHYRPILGASGEVERFMLSLMDGQTTLAEIAERTLQAFPGFFADRMEALTRAGDLSVKHAR
jgi:protein arginine N-methyltransferase 1